MAAARPDWPRAFAEEAARIRDAVPSVIAIEHYGSTAVPGLAAKPIIDLLVGVPSLAAAAAAGPAMLALGYEDRGHAIVAGHHIYGLGEARTHLAHFVAFGGEHWWPPLIFRDRLRAEPALLREYEALKRQLAAEHPSDRRAYTFGKTAFVTRVLAQS